LQQQLRLDVLIALPCRSASPSPVR